MTFPLCQAHPISADNPYYLPTETFDNRITTPNLLSSTIFRSFTQKDSFPQHLCSEHTI